MATSSTGEVRILFKIDGVVGCEAEDACSRGKKGGS